MNLAHNATKVLITGKSGTGKSTYFHKYVLSAFIHTHERILIYDFQGESSLRLNKQPALTVEDLAEQFEKGFVLFDPTELFPGDIFSGWDFFCEWAFERQQSNSGTCLLCCDELQVLSSTGQLSWELSLVIETGRRYGLDFCGVTQQLNLVHNRVRNQMTEMITFQQIDKLVLDALEEKGFDRSEVSRLPKGQFVLQNFNTGAIQRGNIFKGSVNTEKPNEETPRQVHAQDVSSDKSEETAE